MNTNKLVSVIMSTYNEQIAWLKESVESILKQSYQNFEFIIIVDNPNNNDIINYLKSIDDDRVKIFINHKNIGLVKSLNKAIEISKGEYIARMDADDISSINRFREQVEFLNLNKNISLVGSNMELIDENGMYFKKDNNSIIIGSENIKKALKYYNVMNHPTFMVRRDIICSKNINGYRNIKYAEDYDLVCRLVSNGYEIDNIDLKLLQYRIRQNSITRSNEFNQVKVSIYISKLYKKNIINKFDFEYMDKLLTNKNGEKAFYISNKIKSYMVKSNKLIKYSTYLISNLISKYHFIRMKNKIIFRLFN